MDFISQIIHISLNLDTYLVYIVNSFGLWSYVILFLVIFSETGTIVVSFLPGDSLLFVVGALSAKSHLNVVFVIMILSFAAILGDTVNYHIGKFIGPKIFNKQNSKLFSKKHLMEAHDFYEKYGSRTIILARFIPIIRAFAPFVAGIGSMPYKKFLSYNIFGGVLWITLIVSIGYLFGNIPIIKDNFSFLIVFIIVISVLPILLKELLRKYRKYR